MKLEDWSQEEFEDFIMQGKILLDALTGKRLELQSTHYQLLKGHAHKYGITPLKEALQELKDKWKVLSP